MTEDPLSRIDIRVLEIIVEFVEPPDGLTLGQHMIVKFKRPGASPTPEEGR